MEQKNYRNFEQDRRISLVEKSIITYNKEMGDVRKDVATIKTDVEWLKRFFFVVATASIGGLIGSIINLLSK